MAALFPCELFVFFPGSWKTPGSENPLYAKPDGARCPGKPIPSCILPQTETLSQVELKWRLLIGALQM